MKQFLLFMTLCLIPVMSFAQEKDSDGRVVTQNGTQYKVTFNATSDNGGTISETWYGSIVNGKREGTWNFVGNYNKYEISSGIFRTGTVTMTRTYKNGVPNGKYVLKHDLQLMNGGYNIFTDNWIYESPSDYNEYISGAYADGKPTGAWNIYNEGIEKLTITFKNGVMDGTFSITDVIRGLTTKGSFKNGYVLTMKEMLGTDWGYETDYAGKDPSTLQPQETVSLDNVITKWELYTTGMNICNEYMTDYPVNSADERAPEITYIFSDADNYRKLFGNVPKDVMKSLEWNRKWEENSKFEEQDALMQERLDTLIAQYTRDLDPVFHDFLGKSGLMKFYVMDTLVHKIFLQHPEFKTFVDAREAKIKKDGDGNSSSLLWYFEHPTVQPVQNSYKYRYDKICQPLLEQVYEYHGTDNDSTRYYIHKYYTPNLELGLSQLARNSIKTYYPNLWKRMDKKENEIGSWEDYLRCLDRMYFEKTFQPTESDLLHYLAYQYGDATKFRLKSKEVDASTVTKEDVKKFALEYTDGNGKRHYDMCAMLHDGKAINVSVADMLNSLNDTRAFKKLRETVTFEL